MISKEQIAEKYKEIQDEISQAIEQLDGKEYVQEEIWEREAGGGGRTRVIQHGDILEKGGVNFSAVHGELPKQIKDAFGVEENEFFATGISIVIHPNNPFVPIIHMNIRYFELNDEIKWFGGGIDMTPHYVNHQDANYFHGQLKATCDQFNAEFYPKFKEWADNYFFIKHRNETRGIGGIFYDKLTPEKAGISLEEIFNFSCALGRLFPKIYSELVN